MIKVQVNYTTTSGEKKTRNITYANPASSNATLKDFAQALYSLTTNTITDIYKIDTAVLLEDDSDDIVTPIVTTGKQSPNLTLSSYSLEPDTNKTITATFSGNGTVSVSSNGTMYFNYQVSGNSITFTASGEALDTMNGVDESYIVTLSETDEYESDTAVVRFYVAGTPYEEEEEEDEDEEE